MNRKNNPGPWAIIVAFMLIFAAPIFGLSTAPPGFVSVNDNGATFVSAPANINGDLNTGTATMTAVTTFENHGAIPLGGVGMPAFDTNSITPTNIAATNTFTLNGNNTGAITTTGTVSALSFASNTVNKVGTFVGRNNNVAVGKSRNVMVGSKVPSTLVTFRLGVFNAGG